MRTYFRHFIILCISLAFCMPLSYPVNAQRQDSFAGTYVAVRSGEYGTQILTLELNKGGPARLIVERPGTGAVPLESTGFWERNGNGKINVQVVRGTVINNFTFKTDGGVLTTVIWDQEDWGSTPLKFTPRNPARLDGTYTLTRSSANGTQQLTLKLDRNRAATLSVEFVGSGLKPVTYAGSWQRQPSNTISVTVSRDQQSQDLRFRILGNSLLTESWDKSEWGNEPLLFSKR
jgi:hypothetical protein